MAFVYSTEFLENPHRLVVTGLVLANLVNIQVGLLFCMHLHIFFSLGPHCGLRIVTPILPGFQGAEQNFPALPNFIDGCCRANCSHPNQCAHSPAGKFVIDITFWVLTRHRCTGRTVLASLDGHHSVHSHPLNFLMGSPALKKSWMLPERLPVRTKRLSIFRKPTQLCVQYIFSFQYTSNCPIDDVISHVGTFYIIRGLVMDDFACWVLSCLPWTSMFGTFPKIRTLVQVWIHLLGTFSNMENLLRMLYPIVIVTLQQFYSAIQLPSRCIYGNWVQPQLIVFKWQPSSSHLDALWEVSQTRTNCKVSWTTTTVVMLSGRGIRLLCRVSLGSTLQEPVFTCATIFS